MTYLVTGAAGKLGALVVDALLDRGVTPGDVVATARDTGRLSAVAARGVVTRRLDYDDPNSVDAALEGVDRVLLVSSSMVGQRTAQHRTVIEAAARHDVELLAYTSILRADSSSLSLATEHLQTERILADAGVPHVLLRNGWYLENYTDQARTQVEQGVFGAAGSGRISAAARADYAEAAAVALLADDSAGTVYELAGDSAFTMADYAAALSERAGRDVTYTDLPRDEYTALLVSAGVPAPFAEILADTDRGVSAGELFDDSRTLSTLLGRPTTTLVEAVEAALA
ncbi:MULTISPECIES: NAD(P)H-binding protein [unclassified Dietzia]|uniref:NAD(P)H-binding protein n=1 Tax=unclassified Dietzia TaxID=2617939 RepID=UPI000D204EC6|nr:MULTISPECIES: NAD(P)H-binding protein [unclassified Dietzia]AVZ40814.1 NAD(P)-dependent oxidoreductase [Dietzia sp. JS16-p6b]QGW26417.1 NmrA family protein [Dietzia sp. DQ12-45-1b]